MTLSDAQGWIAIIGITGTTVIAIISALKSKSNGAKLDVLGEKSDVLEKKSDVLDRKSDEIHQLTNSNLTAVKADLVIAKNDINFLKEFISKNIKEALPTTPEPEFIAKIELAKPEQPVVNVSPFPTAPLKTP